MRRAVLGAASALFCALRLGAAGGAEGRIGVVGDPAAVASESVRPAEAGETFESAVLFVNGRAVTRSDLEVRTAARYRELDRIRSEIVRTGRWTPRDEASWQAARASAWRQAVRSVVFGEILRVEAESFVKLGMGLSERQVEEYWRRMLKEAGGPAEIARQRGLSVAAFKELARDELLGDAYRHSLRVQLARPTPGELRDYYRFSSESFRRPESVRARAVVIRRFLYDGHGGRTPREGAGRRAEEVLGKLKAGEDFARVAARYSEDTSNAAQDGRLGTEEKGFLIERGTYEAELEKALFGTAPGSPAAIVEGRANFYVLEVLKHYAPGVPPFEEVEDEIFRRCYSDRIRKAEEKFFRDSFEKVLVLDARGRRIGTDEFFAEPSDFRKRSLFDREEEPQDAAGHDEQPAPFQPPAPAPAPAPEAPDRTDPIDPADPSDQSRGLFR